jgi:hypothetical protein
MHRLGLCSAILVVGAGLLLAACGSSDSSPPQSASGGAAGAGGTAGTGGAAGTGGTGGTAGEAGTGGTAGEAGTGGTGGSAGEAGTGGTAGVAGAAGSGAGCGADPGVTATLNLTDVQGKNQLADIAVAPSICPGYSVTTDTNGAAALQFPKNQPLFFELTGTGYIPGLTAELTGIDSGATLSAAMVPESAATQLSALWTAGTGAVFVYTQSLVSSGACSAVDQITFAVPGASGATVIYTGDSGPDPAMTSTGTAGVAIVFNLPASGFVEPTATKSGCNVKLQHTAAQIGYTGRVPVSADKLSFAWAFVEP